MAVVQLKGYFDDSGDATDPQHRACSVGGYVAPAEKWPHFEKAWQQALLEFDVPYLHMKEFAVPCGPYAKWKGNENKKIAFFQRLIEVIGQHGLIGFGATVRVVDVKRFNEERGLHIDAYALGLYGCMLEFFLKFPGAPAKLVIDRFPKAPTKIGVAMQYLETDRYYPKNREYARGVAMLPLGHDATFRSVVAIQAADFAVWEMRKSSENKNDWFDNVKPQIDPKDWFTSQMIWRAVQAKGKPVGFPAGLERRSYYELTKAAHIEGAVWDYDMLCGAHEARGGIWPDAARQQQGTSPRQSY